MRFLGYNVPDFDFILEGVQSITVDPHKMGLSPIPNGGIVFRTKKLIDNISFNVPYLAGGQIKQATLTGTRPGAAVIATWALFKHLGIEEYSKIIEKIMKLRDWFLKQLVKLKAVRIARDPLK